MPASQVGEWVTVSCPLAAWRHQRGTDRNPSFGVRVEPGCSRVHCFSCNYSGDQVQLLLLLSGLLRGHPHSLDLKAAMRMAADAEDGAEAGDLWGEGEEAEAGADVEFPEWWLETFPRAWPCKPAREYLKSRAVPRAVAEALDLRHSSRERRVCFPVRNWEGRLVGLHGRTYEADAVPIYRMFTYQGQKNPMAWLGESWIDPERPVVLAESVFDLARIYQCYRNSACALTASIGARKIARLEACDEIVLVMDADKPGDEAARRIEGQLGGHALVRRVRLPDGSDPGSLSVAHVAEVLADYVDLDEVLV